MLTLVIMLVAVSEPAQAPAGPASTEKLICKRIDDNSTGWRVQSNRKVCRTAAEWRALDDETYRAVNRAKDKGLFDPNGVPKGR